MYDILIQNRLVDEIMYLLISNKEYLSFLIIKLIDLLITMVYDCAMISTIDIDTMHTLSLFIL
jgi:hypothetical protein